MAISYQEPQLRCWLLSAQLNRVRSKISRLSTAWLVENGRLAADAVKLGDTSQQAIKSSAVMVMIIVVREYLLANNNFCWMLWRLVRRSRLRHLSPYFFIYLCFNSLCQSSLGFHYFIADLAVAVAITIAITAAIATAVASYAGYATFTIADDVDPFATFFYCCCRGCIA